MKKNIILLCDYGLDDAAATAFLLQNAACFNRIDILPIGGNVPLAVSTQNAHRILYHFNGNKDKVRIIDTSCVAQNNSEYLQTIHGDDGIGNVLPDEYEPFANTGRFENWVNSIEPGSVLVSLGPCTVTQRILERKDDLTLLLMAGNIGEKPNYKGYEFNHGMDPDAFAASVKYPHVIATLDTCHHPLCDFYDIENNGNTLLHRFCRRSVELLNKQKGEGAFIYDLIALQYLYKPEAFAVEEHTDKDGNRLNVLKYISDEKIVQLSE